MSELSDPTTMASEWQEVLNEHPLDVTLRHHYLMQQQTHISTFSMEQTSQVYHQAFNQMVSALESGLQMPQNMEQQVIGMLQRFSG